MAGGSGFGLVLVAADDYPDPPGHLPSSDSAHKLAALLGSRGARLVKQVLGVRLPQEVLDALDDWVQRREEEPVSTFIYLVGHGKSDGDRHWLLLPGTHERPNQELRTSGLADLLIRDWDLHREADPSSWTVFVLDCCASDVAVTNLLNELTAFAGRRPRRLGLWPVTPQGASHSGRFVEALDHCLATFTENDERIPLEEVIRRIEPALGGLEHDGYLPDDAALENPIRTEATITMSLDAYAELRRAIDHLPTEVRSHFLAKAQGAEVGELAWHFCGRQAEIAALSSWLRDAPSGIRVVTGEPGVGKSALLGHLVVLADEDLVAALAQSAVGLSTVAPRWGKFDAVIHLTGKTLAACVAEAAGAIGASESGREELDAEVVLRRLSGATHRLTLLADALDEAQEPLQIADFFRRAAEAPSVRVLLGTRRSLDEGPDYPVLVDRHELLDALDANEGNILVVARDPAASAEYVRRRLRVSGSPYAGNEEAIARIAQRVADRDEPFLFARLATAELLARPAIDPDDPELVELLAGGHRGLFAAALSRLGGEDPALVALLHALSFARGRGFPETSGVWVKAAASIGPDPVIPDEAVRRVIDRAAAYVTLDGEGLQSTFRLAHKTYVEHFRALADADGPTHRSVAAALQRDLDRDGGWDAANYYVVRYLPEHLVADAERSPPDVDGLAQLVTDPAWLRRALALLGIDGLVDVLQRSYDAVPLEALGTLIRTLRRSRVALSRDPGQLAAQLHAHLKDSSGTDLKRVVGALSRISPGPWLRLQTPALLWLADLETTLPTEGKVRALSFGSLGGRTILAIGVDDRVIVWDPQRGAIEERVLRNEGARVTALSVAELRGRPVAVIGAGYDGRLVFRDLRSGKQIGHDLPLEGYVKSVALGRLDEQLAVAASGNGQVWAWDVTTGDRAPVVESVSGRIDGVTCVGDRIALLTLSTDERGLALASIVDATTGEPFGSPLVLAMLDISEAGMASTDISVGHPILVASHSSGITNVWDPVSQASLGPLLELPSPVRAIAIGQIDDLIVVAAAPDFEGSGFVSLREASTARRDIPHRRPVSETSIPIIAVTRDPDGTVLALTGHVPRVMEVPLTGEEPLVVREDAPTVEMVTAMLGGDPAQVQFSVLDEELDPAHPVHRLLTVADLVDRPRGRKHWSGQRAFRQDQPGTWPVTHDCWATLRGRAIYAAGAYSHVVWLWDLQAGEVVAGPFAEIPLQVALPPINAKGGPPPVTSIALAEVEGRALLAAACDGRVRLWDIDTADERQAPELGTAVVTAVALGAVAGRNILVTGSKGGVLTTWDVNRGEHLAAITLDEGIDSVWVVRNSDMICALTDARMLHLLEFEEASGD